MLVLHSEDRGDREAPELGEVVGRKKWCFGRRDVICLTKGCPYMGECIQLVYEQRVIEVEALLLARRRTKLPTLMRAARTRRRRDGEKL